LLSLLASTDIVYKNTRFHLSALLISALTSSSLDLKMILSWKTMLSTTKSSKVEFTALKNITIFFEIWNLSFYLKSICMNMYVYVQIIPLFVLVYPLNAHSIKIFSIWFNLCLHFEILIQIIQFYITKQLFFWNVLKIQNSSPSTETLLAGN